MKKVLLVSILLLGGLAAEATDLLPTEPVPKELEEETSTKFTREKHAQAEEHNKKVSQLRNHVNQVNAEIQRSLAEDEAEDFKAPKPKKLNRKPSLVLQPIEKLTPMTPVKSQSIISPLNKNSPPIKTLPQKASVIKGGSLHAHP